MRNIESNHRITLFVAIALLAFAANSILCRLALREAVIDPYWFTLIRLASGAATLVPLALWFRKGHSADAGAPSIRSAWRTGSLLFGYAAAFGTAYVTLDAGIGALILFGSVQVTMMCAALIRGERLNWCQWLGFITAVCGLTFICWPGASAFEGLSSQLSGVLLMSLAGVAWGLYSVAGKGVKQPIAMSAWSFSWAVPMAAVLCVVQFAEMHVELLGAGLAAISGALTSGLGYVIWYRTLPSLATSRAAMVQLLVPVIAAVAGVLFLGETISPRLLLGAALVLGGFATTIVFRGSSAAATKSAS